MTFEPEPDSDELRSDLQRLVLPWLSQADASLEHLVDWLQGYGLPPAGQDEEPYVWLLRGLPRGRQRGQAVRRLSERMADLLRQEPDRFRPGRRPERVLYNSLMLCAALSVPDTLAEPLDAVFRRGVIDGDWNGLALREALLMALIYNQRDDRWARDWQQFLAGRHPFLPGGPYDGFRGVLRMPPPGKGPGEPALDAIGHALLRMGDYLNDRHYPERRPRFRELLSWIEDTYPSNGRSRDLLHLADKQDWPEWMVTCLPELSIDFGPQPDGRQRLLLWEMIARFLPEQEIARGSATLCNGLLTEILVPAEWQEEVKEIADSMENARRNSPYSSYGALGGAAAQAMIYQEVAAHGRQAGTPLEMARRQQLREHRRQKDLPRSLTGTGGWRGASRPASPGIPSKGK